MGRVKNKIALITGAAQGIGAATALMLAKEGAQVILTDINEAGVKEQSDEINNLIPNKSFFLYQDVRSESRWKEIAVEVEEKYGGLSILVNNAGIGSIGNVEEENFETWKNVHAVDLDSIFLGCKYLIPLITDSGGGSIINMSSISGIIAGHNMAAYNSAKAGVRHLTKSIALHCANTNNRIRCNSVHPVFIDTPILDDFVGEQSRKDVLQKLGRQVPLGKVGKPDDVAYAILYLASDESQFITGTEIRVDGGISAM